MPLPRSLAALSVRHKLLAGFLAAALLSGVTGTVGVLTANGMGKDGEQVAVELAPLADAAMEIKLTATRAHLLFEEIMAGDESEEIEEVWSLLEETLFYADAILKGGENDEGRIVAAKDPAVLEKVRSVWAKTEAFIAAAHERYDSRGAGDGKAGTAADEVFDRSYESLMADADAAEMLIHEGIDRALGHMRAGRSEGLILLVGFTVGAIAAALVCALLIGRSVAGRIHVLSGVMAELAEGRLDTEVRFTGHGDEIGAMARTVQVFKDNGRRAEALRAEQAAEQQAREERSFRIETLCNAFDSSATRVLDTVSQALAEVRSAAETMTGTAERTARQATAVAGSAESAMTSVDTAASGTEELSSSISEIARQVAQSNDFTGRAVSETEGITSRVKGLDEAAQQIGAVIGLISEIAEQTNLLALNATIEAARAGDAGKGFAVVAHEVKNLATQTAKATEEISAQIRGMQQATGDAVSAIDGIRNIIAKINDSASAIAAAVQQQDAATNEITRNVRGAAENTRGVSSAIGEVQEAAGETGGQARTVLSSAQELASQSDSLQSEVHSFLQAIRAA